jgi:hypothetical protein
MPSKSKTFRDYFGEENLITIRQTLEVLFSSPGGSVMIILPPNQGNPHPKIVDAYFNIHANCVRGIVNTSLKDAVNDGLLIEGFPEKFYIDKHNHKKHNNDYRNGGKQCLIGVKTH